ncbi:hypothetical protein [Ruminococcus sp.]|uniref:hypothetical protein n=1 Tax=Ruminococcus sp. TaxID=41978 RepID=UPI0025D44C38|nr:hypothetical protein [Ruminococcus sp.]
MRASLDTKDTKQGGPYMSLLQFEDDIMPFTFADVLILRYLVCSATGKTNKNVHMKKTHSVIKGYRIKLGRL